MKSSEGDKLKIVKKTDISDSQNTEHQQNRPIQGR